MGSSLSVVSAAALCGGVTLYLLGHNAFRLRDVGSVSVPRLIAAVISLALTPATVRMPALFTLAVTLALLTALVAYETTHLEDSRRKLRAEP